MQQIFITCHEMGVNRNSFSCCFLAYLKPTLVLVHYKYNKPKGHAINQSPSAHSCNHQAIALYGEKHFYQNSSEGKILGPFAVKSIHADDMPQNTGAKV